MAVAGIGLGDLIVTTAEEIRKARDKSAELGDPVLALEGCELELKVTMKAEAGAGIKVWLLDLSTKGGAERASTITLKFGPATGGKPGVFLTEGNRNAIKQSGSIVPVKRAVRTKGVRK
jgi:Trypsin-co-occurring domain 2